MASFHNGLLAQGTAFTYQGQLNSGGSPANGNYDFTFALFNTNHTSGGQVGGTLTNLDVGVTNGLFLTALDFGDVFTGNDAWLAMSVCSNGVDSFTPLTPLQELFPTPYAIFANTASNVLGAVPASQLSGLISPGQLPNVLGGSGNTLDPTDPYSVIGGGQVNTIGAGANYSVLSGGVANTIFGSALYATIVGGTENQIWSGGVESFIGGGVGNTVESDHSFLGGGLDNIIQASASYATLGGGLQNFIDTGAQYAFLGGGNNNQVSGSYGTVGGGTFNQASNYATVPGGVYNVASGAFSFAAGADAQAIHTGAFVWSDAEGPAFASTNTNSFNVRANGGVRFVTGGAGLTVDGQPVLSGTVGLGQLPETVVTNNEAIVSLNDLFLSGILSLPPTAKILVGLTPMLSADTNGNSCFGLDAGQENQSGSGNVAVGYFALQANTSGYENIAIGDGALANATNPIQEVAIGYQALQNDASSSGNQFQPSGNNTAVGYQALQENTTGSYNTALGYMALSDNSTQGDNVAIGASALGLEGYNSDGGYGNTAVGSEAFENMTSGNGNVALGWYAGSALASGDNNICIGNQGQSYLQFSGSGNIELGATAGSALGSGDNNIYIENPGVNGESGVIRIGTDGTHKATYLVGPVYASTFVSSSDRNIKENFKPVDAREVLEKVAAMPVTRWNYKRNDSSDHIGPMAQDFYAAFNVGPDDKHITSVDEGGVAFVAIQGLNQKLEEKDAEIKALQVKAAQVDSLEKRLNELEQIVQKLAAGR